MNLENYFISQFHSKSIGDDGALMGEEVYSMDAFFENIHFKKSWLSYYQIAKKAMVINISDAIAMNAKPKYALLSVAMPSGIKKSQMRELVCGFEDGAKEYGVEIIGGDTISNAKLDISITIISQTSKPLRRVGARVGDMVGFTGKLGNSKKDLQKLMNLGKIHKNSKFVNIKLRDKFITNSIRNLKAGMDISDGLFSELQKISDINRVGFKFLQHISKDVGCSGEEYEMLFVFDKRDLKTIKRRAKQSRTEITIFAQATRQRYTNRCKSHHF